MLLNLSQGAPIMWLIGSRGDPQPDLHPGLLVRTGQGTDDRGVAGFIATVILLRTNLAGEQYLASANILEKYVDDRDFRVEALDGTAEKPKSLATVMKELGAQRTDYLTRGSDPIVIGEATADAEAEAAAATEIFSA
jgi:hypothetical protein